MATKTPSAYEMRAIKAIHVWKNPKKRWYNKALSVVNWPIDKTSTLVMKTPGVNWVITKAIGGLVSILNDFAHLTVRSEAIYKEFRSMGCEVRKSHDIFSLDLEHIDKAIGSLGVKYKSLALVEGGGTGFVGLPGIPADIVAVVSMNQRAIGEYATYCGFDVSLQEERQFAMNILGCASSTNDVAKQAAMANLARLAKNAAMKKPWIVLEESVFTKIIQSFVPRLTKAKLAQILPLTGAAIGGRFNVYFTNKVCNTAYFVYRERFLAEKYGPNIIKSYGESVEGLSFSDDGGEIDSVPFGI